MIRILIILLLARLLSPAELRAEDGLSALLMNDKEAISHLYTRAEWRGASRRLGGRSAQTHQALLGALETLSTAQRLCGATLLEEWRNRLRVIGESTESTALIDSLILSRSANRIDDILFKIIEDDLTLFEDLQSNSSNLPRIQKRDLYRISEFMKANQLTTEDLFRILRPFKGSNLRTPGCTYSEYRKLAGKYSNFPTLIAAGRVHRVLDESAALLLHHYDQSGFESSSMPVEQYLNSLKRVKNREKRTLEPSRFLSERPKNSKGLTRRELLYFRFDPTQIRMMNTVMKRLFSRMDSTRTDLVFTRTDGSTESIPLSPMGQYYFARKLLKRDLDELSGSFFFQGLSPTFEDLLSAALETGLISTSDLDPLLEVDDLWNPNVPGWKRASDLAFRITGSASLFLPPPYNTLTSVALVLLNGFIDRKTRAPSQGDPGYDPF
jgi:hypothetical protein